MASSSTWSGWCETKMSSPNRYTIIFSKPRLYTLRQILSRKKELKKWQHRHCQSLSAHFWGHPHGDRPLGMLSHYVSSNCGQDFSQEWSWISLNSWNNCDCTILFLIFSPFLLSIDHSYFTAISLCLSCYPESAWATDPTNHHVLTAFLNGSNYLLSPRHFLVPFMLVSSPSRPSAFRLGDVSPHNPWLNIPQSLSLNQEQSIPPRHSQSNLCVKA